MVPSKTSRLGQQTLGHFGSRAQSRFIRLPDFLYHLFDLLLTLPLTPTNLETAVTNFLFLSALFY